MRRLVRLVKCKNDNRSLASHKTAGRQLRVAKQNKYKFHSPLERAYSQEHGEASCRGQYMNVHLSGLDSGVQKGAISQRSYERLLP